MGHYKHEIEKKYLGPSHCRLKAHTHTPIFGGSAIASVIETADSSSELADSNANSPVGM